MSDVKYVVGHKKPLILIQFVLLFPFANLLTQMGDTSNSSLCR